MKVLFVTSEAVPFSKTGGLADVAYALPKALRKQGVDARVITSRSFALSGQQEQNELHMGHYFVEVGWRQQYAGLSQLKHDGIPYYFIDNEYYFKRDSMYGHYDDGERFAFFNRAVLESIRHMDFQPDVIHFNDWHTGMLPALLNRHYRHDPTYRDLRTVYTIHNLRYQGVFQADVLDNLLNMERDHYHSGAIEFHGGISFMKSGIQFADAVTTVSETYATEIQYPFFGERLDGLIRDNAHKVVGITNGVDHDLYNPRKDPHIEWKYDGRTIKKKRDNKVALQRELGLPENPDIPLIGMVTRLANMKGMDLVAHVLHEVLAEDVQFVVLGTGEPQYEHMLRYFQHEYPDRVRAQLTFDVPLSHRIYAGADLFLMPSLFEPCGLGQQIAMRYGTLPIVRETGGLRDTVTPYNEHTGEGNGFSFANYNAHELLFTIQRALRLYESRREWNRVVRQAMKSDTSWSKSAKAYRDVYENVLKSE